MMNSNDYHVFFTDDEAKVRRVVAETLKQNGFRVSCFASPEECIKQLYNQRCDLLITDLKMPNMNGIELVRETKHIAPWMPTLIFTGYGDIPTAVEAIKAGAFDFIEKPLDKKSFVSKVKSLLSGNGNHKHLKKVLTQAEEKVLKLILDGKSNREIADLLNRSQRTIEVHRAHIKNKLGADSLVDLVKRAVQMGLVDF